MERNNILISAEKLAEQTEYSALCGKIIAQKLCRKPLACTVTFGCQQNEADTELIRRMLVDMGFEFTEIPEEADLVIAVGARFSDRATGNVSKYAKNSKIIQLDPDFSEINKNVKVDLGIVADVEHSFRAIAKLANGKTNPDWCPHIAYSTV